MKFINSTETIDRPIGRELKGTPIYSAITDEDLDGEYWQITSEASESSTSYQGGSIRMLCVPTDTPGPFWGGSLVYRSGCFDEWLSSDGNATIRADAHGHNPYFNLASRNVGGAPGGVVFSVDDRGLWAEVNLLFGDEVSENILSRVKAGIIDTCSVGTNANKVEEDFENDITSIVKCDVFETSMVCSGEERYADTEVKANAVGISGKAEIDDGMTGSEILAKLEEKDAVPRTTEGILASSILLLTEKVASIGKQIESLAADKELPNKPEKASILRLVSGNVSTTKEVKNGHKDA